MKISDEVMGILSRCQVKENVLFLPNEQIERKTYLAVNKVLESMGGKWSRKEQGHIFQPEDDLPEQLEIVLDTGTVQDPKKEFQYFWTPRPVAEKLCDWAELDENSYILEPSIGDGRLADVAMEHHPAWLVGVELNPKMHRKLEKKPYPAFLADFLTMTEDDLPFSMNRVVMNPPFRRFQDIMHIRHAYDLMAAGGILVSVVCESPFFRSEKLAVEFREFLDERCAEVIRLDAGAFRESGTAIQTRIIKIRKPS